MKSKEEIQLIYEIDEIKTKLAQFSYEINVYKAKLDYKRKELDRIEKERMEAEK